MADHHHQVVQNPIYPLVALALFRPFISDRRIKIQILDYITAGCIRKKSSPDFGTNKILSKFFGYCVQECYIKRNPYAGIKLAAYKEVDDEVRDEGAVETFTEDEINRYSNTLIRTSSCVL
ncbi:MAG: hypothetical protein HGA49_03995 [Eubacteriaceae bacterium]|nr:hypothetical protein [Eubacteriaceae bacterium]